MSVAIKYKKKAHQILKDPTNPLQLKFWGSTRWYMRFTPTLFRRKRYYLTHFLKSAWKAQNVTSLTFTWHLANNNSAHLWPWESNVSMGVYEITASWEERGEHNTIRLWCKQLQRESSPLLPYPADCEQLLLCCRVQRLQTPSSLRKVNQIIPTGVTSIYWGTKWVLSSTGSKRNAELPSNYFYSLL